MIVLIIRSGTNNPNEYTDSHVKKIKKASKSVRVFVVDPIKDQVDRKLKTADIIISPKKNIFNFLDVSQAKKLKWLHITSAGISTVVSKIKNPKVIITSSSGVSRIPIAEHVFAYILMFTRQIISSYKNQKKHIWESPTPQEVYGKNIGIVGYGRVGKRIAEVAKAFGMHIYTIAHTKSIKGTGLHVVDNIKEVLNKSDYVIDCLPITNETKNYFNLEKFKQMKRSGYFINVSTGDSVDEKDLVIALENKLIAGAGLDVFLPEPLPPASKLWNFENVIITAHNAGKTPLYTDRVIDVFCENLAHFLKSQPLPNKVDIMRGY